MAFKKLSGPINLFLDLGISMLLAIAFMLIKEPGPENDIEEGIGTFIVRVLGSFCFFFVWSWRPIHVQSSEFARGMLHLICISTLLLFFIFLTVFILNVSEPKAFSFFGEFLIFLVWGIGIAIKYKQLFWPRKISQKTEPKQT